VIVLYDADCGFCRWATAWVLRLDRRHLLVPVPIQSALGSELLSDLSPEDRLRAAHVVGEDGRRCSGGAAAGEVLGALDRTRVLAGMLRRWPRTTDRLYAEVARRRIALGRFVGQAARQRADRLLEAARATSADDLELRSQRPPA
jgi:predicted DCC family thiol-disulfide oxidoreductase YuxK